MTYLRTALVVVAAVLAVCVLAPFAWITRLDDLPYRRRARGW